MPQWLAWTRACKQSVQGASFRSMSTLAEIEAALPQLTAGELAELEQFLRKAKREKAAEPGRSVLDMEPLNLGAMLRPLGTREEWYDEMLEGRV